MLLSNTAPGFGGTRYIVEYVKTSPLRLFYSTKKEAIEMAKRLSAYGYTVSVFKETGVQCKPIWDNWYIGDKDE